VDRNKNTIEGGKTLRGDVIQKQYARKTREEKLKEMDRRRSSAAKVRSEVKAMVPITARKLTFAPTESFSNK
jgi:hypothetical protein